MNVTTRRSPALPLAATLGAVGVLVIRLRATGQPWWCSCGTLWPWGYPTQSMHNSQHLIDLYSLSHVLHGVIFYFALVALRKKIPLAWRLFVAVVIEIGWEWLENSPLIIDRYRNGTAALGYAGDSTINSVGDVLSAIGGFWIAHAIGWRWSIAFFIAVELLMLALIRDNLTLNVLMLIHPFEAIRQWQMH